MTELDPATRAQVRAADPGQSVWVSANAGSGKTKVLTDRVARLLLHGTSPARILCLTYTRAAAAEMQNRLFQRLGAWAMMPEDKLREALARLGEPADQDPETLRRARRLFAKALETPGGLKIQTIHAFCDHILRRFPLEAGISLQFQALDDVAAARLRAEVLEEMASGEDAACVRALADELTGDEIDKLLARLPGARRALRPELIAQALGEGDEPDWEEIAEEIAGPDGREILAAVAELVGDSAQYGAKLAALALTDNARAFVQEAERLFVTGVGAKEPFSAKQLGNKTLRGKFPAVFESLDALADRVARARARRADARLAMRTARLARFAERFVEEYERRKVSLGLLDFDDLITRTAALLSTSASAQWVLYRLDGGIEHILVDEAQDTSPEQWEVIARLAEEFTAGMGRFDKPRTLFVVGDEKQSIYSFQGADPKVFSQMLVTFRSRFEGAGLPLAEQDMAHSFRSADPILRLVDAVFAGPAGKGFTAQSQHVPFFADLPGRVDLWPFLEAPEKPEPNPWYVPPDLPSEADPRRLLAERVAEWIAHHITAGTVLPGDPPRPVTPGDFLILVQRRGPFFAQVIKELKRRRIPVAGADRMKLGEELAAKDLLALLRWADLPDDDLALAEVMRSPLLGLSEGDLFALAHGRGHATLWQRLRDTPAHGEAAAMLRDVLAQTDFMRPYELLERALTVHGGRERLLARLGEEAEDAIDELLAQALRYEQTDVPSLSGFLAWFEQEEVEVKREMDQGAGEVRVMTVHGAKGLEAPIVILPDTAVPRGGRHGPALLETESGAALWPMPKGDDKSLSTLQLEAEARRKAFEEAERLRLLYVAMTRAEQWLVIAGAGDRGKEPLSSWYNIVEAAFSDAEGASILPVQTAEDPVAGQVRTLRWNWEEAQAPGEARASETAAELPGWAKTPAPPAPREPARLKPSDLPGSKVLEIAGAAPGALFEEAAMRRGTAIHLLLEALPELAPDMRPEAARRLLALQPELSPQEREEAVAVALRVLQAPDIEWLFAEGTLAEVPLSVAVPELGGVVVEGIVDRLLVTPERIVVADFKTNALVPETADKIPEGILAQMGAYAAALGTIYPGRQIETGIVWTATASYMLVPRALAMAALRRAPLTMAPAIST